MQYSKSKYYEKIDIVNKVMKIIHNIRKFLLNPTFEKMVLSILAKSNIKNFMTNLIFINEILEIAQIQAFFKKLELDFKRFGNTIISKKYEDSRIHVYELYSNIEEFKQELNFLKHFKTHLEHSSPKENEKSIKHMIMKEIGECHSHRKSREEQKPEIVDPALVAQQWELLESKLIDYEEAQKKKEGNQPEKSKKSKNQTNGKSNGNTLNKKVKKGKEMKEMKDSKGKESIESSIESQLKQKVESKEQKQMKETKESKESKGISDSRNTQDQKVVNTNKDLEASPEKPSKSSLKKKKNKNKSKKQNKMLSPLKEGVNLNVRKTTYLENLKKRNSFANDFLDEIPKSCNSSDLNAYDQNTNSILQSLEINWSKISSRPLLATISNSGLNQLKEFCKMIHLEAGLKFC